MKTLLKLLMFFSVVILSACEETIEPRFNNSDPLIGSWINPHYSDTLWQFEKANTLQDDSPGITFKADGLLIERKNAGWCGTPPITYANYDGTWTRNDSLIRITVDYWGGKADYQWKIISMDDRTLTVYRVKDEYHFQE